MNIAIIGYGKMGKAIEAIALAKGHQVPVKISSQNKHEFTADNLQQCDVAIEFTNPHSAVENIKTCIDAGLPVISGTTGWLEELEFIKQYVAEKKAAFLYASNFSIGVNIFFEVNKKLASLMAGHPSYHVGVEEIHHTAKKDAPSGTAISLAEQIIANYPGKNKWVNDGVATEEEVAIVSKRIDPAPGTHHVVYSSSIDDIEIIHTAHNRQGFAVGAVLAAEYIAGRHGFFSMKDVLGF
ncbi:MAG: 4-hydroxy-tetrahydrodipicolinate reductase [Chitinophagaceae bacterium]|nr:MAG: 4-hydroxy-tetrahydrodipicolinate reductase [Chitinophagaceae bacterium]